LSSIDAFFLMPVHAEGLLLLKLLLPASLKLACVAEIVLRR
jgi:hypothetical protein